MQTLIIEIKIANLGAVLPSFSQSLPDSIFNSSAWMSICLICCPLFSLPELKLHKLTIIKEFFELLLPSDSQFTAIIEHVVFDVIDTSVSLEAFDRLVFANPALKQLEFVIFNARIISQWFLAARLNSITKENNWKSYSLVLYTTFLFWNFSLGKKSSQLLSLIIFWGDTMSTVPLRWGRSHTSK